MSKRNSVVLTFFLFSLLKSTTLFSEKNIADISFDHKKYDYGRVTSGERVKHSFSFVNKGNSDLVIQRVVASCGCTASSSTKDLIAPGERAEIDVDFDTTGFSGSKKKTVRVYSNDHDESIAVLTLDGRIDKGFSVVPSKVIFGNINIADLKTSKKQNIRILSGDRKILVKEVSSSSSFLELGQYSKTKEGYVFPVSLSLNTSIGSLRSFINIKYQYVDDDKILEAKVPVFAVIQGPITFKPRTLSFGVLYPNDKPVEKEIEVLSSKSKSFEILNVINSNPAIKVKVDKGQSARKHKLFVSIDTSKLKSLEVNEEITVVTNSKVQPNLTFKTFALVSSAN